MESLVWCGKRCKTVRTAAKVLCVLFALIALASTLPHTVAAESDERMERTSEGEGPNLNDVQSSMTNALEQLMNLIHRNRAPKTAALDDKYDTGDGDARGPSDLPLEGPAHSDDPRAPAVLPPAPPTARIKVTVSKSCYSRLSCNECYNAGPFCQWCAPQIGVGGQSMPNVMGRCIESLEKCEDKKFGDIDDIVSAPGVMTYEVKSVDPDSEMCDSAEWPSEISKHPNCETCTAADGFGWCNISVSFLGIAITGGFCQRHSAHNSCGGDLVPIPSILPLAKLSFEYDQHPHECPARVKPPPVAPQPECDLYTSCGSCLGQGNECTWCGGILDSSASGGLTISEFPLYGRCVPAAASCDDIQLPNLKSLLELSVVYGDC